MKMDLPKPEPLPVEKQPTTLADELAKAAEHLARAIAASRRGASSQGERDTLVAIKSLVEAGEKRARAAEQRIEAPSYAPMSVAKPCQRFLSGELPPCL